MASAVVLSVNPVSASRVPMVFPSAALPLDGAVTKKRIVELDVIHSSESAVSSRLFLRARCLLLFCLLFLTRPLTLSLESADPPLARLARDSRSEVFRPSAARNTATAVIQLSTAVPAVTPSTATASLLFTAPSPAHLFL
jgi:hypothetical protein